VQVDYNLPSEDRFNLSYIGADNAPHHPVMVHRAPFGSMERFVGLLIEHFEGAFPTWLAPEQVRVLPISEKFHDAAQVQVDALLETGARVRLDDAAEKIGAKIRLAQLDKVPYMLIIGANEVESNTVSVRHRRRGDLGSLRPEEFLAQFREEVSSRSL
jgi:threonyl-tRNA synthetase